MFVMVPRAAASAERIQQVLDSEAELCDPDEPFELTDPIGLVEFDNVPSSATGRRGNRCCATSRSTAKPGQTTAIVGSTGAGAKDDACQT